MHSFLFISTSPCIPFKGGFFDSPVDYVDYFVIERGLRGVFFILFTPYRDVVHFSLYRPFHRRLFIFSHFVASHEGYILSLKKNTPNPSFGVFEFQIWLL